MVTVTAKTMHLASVGVKRCPLKEALIHVLAKNVYSECWWAFCLSGHLQLSVAESLLVALLPKIEDSNKFKAFDTEFHLQNIDCAVSLVALVGARQRKPCEAIEVVLLQLNCSLEINRAT
jgi:hypothetical protein